MTKAQLVKEFGKMDKATLEVLLDRVRTEWTDWLALPASDRAKRVRRTAALEQAMAMGVIQYGKESARKVFPEFMEQASISAMAGDSGIDRGYLSQCLGGSTSRSFSTLKERLDEYMELAPGTAGRMISQVGAL